jgi:hypothetical protein
MNNLPQIKMEEKELLKRNWAIFNTRKTFFSSKRYCYKMFANLTFFLALVLEMSRTVVGMIWTRLVISKLGTVKYKSHFLGWWWPMQWWTCITVVVGACREVGIVQGNKANFSWFIWAPKYFPSRDLPQWNKILNS